LRAEVVKDISKTNLLSALVAVFAKIGWDFQ
jgi:hypothetical protein